MSFKSWIVFMLIVAFVAPAVAQTEAQPAPQQPDTQVTAKPGLTSSEDASKNPEPFEKDAAPANQPAPNQVASTSTEAGQPVPVQTHYTGIDWKRVWDGSWFIVDIALLKYLWKGSNVRAVLPEKFYVAQGEAMVKAMETASGTAMDKAIKTQFMDQMKALGQSAKQGLADAEIKGARKLFWGKVLGTFLIISDGYKCVVALVSKDPNPQNRESGLITQYLWNHAISDDWKQ